MVLHYGQFKLTPQEYEKGTSIHLSHAYFYVTCDVELIDIILIYLHLQTMAPRPRGEAPAKRSRYV